MKWEKTSDTKWRLYDNNRECLAFVTLEDGQYVSVVADCCSPFHTLYRAKRYAVGVICGEMLQEIEALKASIEEEENNA